MASLRIWRKQSGRPNLSGHILLERRQRGAGRRDVPDLNRILQGGQVALVLRVSHLDACLKFMGRAENWRNVHDRVGEQFKFCTLDTSEIPARTLAPRAVRA